MAAQGGSRTAVVAAVVGNFLIAVIKFIAAAITGSSAMISEGIHSLVDTGNGGLLLHGMKQARVPADEQHPFGHGKSLYFWTLVVGISIFGIGGGMSLYEGISHIRHVAPGGRVGDPTANYVVLGIAALVEGWSFGVAVREFMKAKGDKKSWDYIREAKDPSTYTVVLEDGAALTGLLFAFLGVFFGHWLQNPYLDGIASIVIGLLLMSVAFVLVFETKGLLLGEGVDAQTLARMRRLVAADPAVGEVGDILTMYMGPYELLVNLSVRFKQGIPVEEVRAAIERIEAALVSAYPMCARIYIEADPLRPALAGEAPES